MIKLTAQTVRWTYGEIAGKAAIYIVLSVVGFLMVLPFIWMISSSFKPIQEFYLSPPKWLPIEATLDNFRQLFKRMNFLTYYKNSIFVTVVQTVSTLFFSALAGYGFAKFKFPGRDKIFLVILATMMVPFPVTIITLYIMTYSVNLTNTYMGLIFPELLTAFGVFLMRQFMTGIPNALLDASRIDGCGEFRIFWSIVLPLCKPVLAALTIFTFMQSWNTFIWPLLVVNEESLRTIPLGISMLSGQWNDAYNLKMAAAALAIMPVLMVFLTMQKQFIQGITMTGMKG